MEELSSVALAKEEGLDPLTNSGIINSKINRGEESMSMSCRTARSKVQKMINRHKRGTETQKEEDAAAHIASCDTKSCQNLYENWRAYLKPTLEWNIKRLRGNLEEKRETKEELSRKLDAGIRKLEIELEAAIALHTKYWPNSPLPNKIFLKEEEETENGKEN